MGTETSSTIRPPDKRSRPLWQVPIFFIGVTALGLAWFMRSPVDVGRRQIATLLSRASQNLDRPDGDVEAALDDAQQAVERIGADGERAGEANLLLGTARIRLAERAAPEAANSFWVAARQALEQAQREDVPPKSRTRLHYRLAKVAFHLGDDPHHVAEEITANVPEGEEAADAYMLLSEAYTRQTPPDYSKALDAITKLREQSFVRDDMLAKVKLRSGELKLKLGRAEEARKDLELIGPGAPAAALSRARLLRARSYQEDGKWAEAASMWQAALADTRDGAERTEMLYLLGVCHRRLDQPSEAIKAWEECTRTGAGTPEAVAAGIQLAELRLERKEYAAALELLANATAKVQQPSEWNNPYVDRDRACEVLEKASKAFRGAAEFELAMRLNGQFEKLATPGRTVALKAEVSTEWARKRSTPADGGKLSPEEEKAASDLFARAGAAYLEVAAAAPEDGRADLLWQAAGRFVEGHDLEKAVVTLEQFLQTEKRPDRIGEGWFLLGEAKRQSKDVAGAEAAYLACVGCPTSFQYRARYQLAMLYWQAGKADQAREQLGQNLHLLAFDHDTEALEKSLYALGNFAYQRHDYAEVVKRLEQALSQFPANPEQTRARYELANSYRQLAAEAKRDEMLGDSPNPEYIKHLQEKHRQYLQKAAREYEELATFLEKPESAGHLTIDERIEVPFTAAQCYFDLGMYAEALTVYDRLLQTNTDQHVTLQALGGAARCHLFLRQEDKARERLDEIRKGLAGLKKAEQKEWEEWLSLASKPGPH
jgi:tetratricopeptide (TPR) repeat protein